MPQKKHLTTLENQCDQIGWELGVLKAKYLGNKLWYENGINYSNPEELVLNHLKSEGINCSWCEGGSINLLIKASALEILTKLNIFSSREDAITRYLEAQLTILHHHKADILASIKGISLTQLKQNISEISENVFIREYYPNVTESFLLLLSNHIELNFIAEIAELFFNNPYKYRAGWPDIIILKNNHVSFIEVKTTDLLHESQLRFALEIAKPLKMDCKVLQLTHLT